MITSEYIFNMYLSLHFKVCVYVYFLLLLFSRQVMSDFFATPCTAALQAFPVPHHLPEFAQVHVHEHEHVGDAIQPSHPLSPTSPSANHLILCHPLLLPSIFPSFRVFTNESALRIKWPKYWSFSFSISPSSEYEGFISFRIDWYKHMFYIFKYTLQVYTHTCTHIYTQHTYTHMYTHNTHIYTHIYTYTHTHKCIYTRIHTIHIQTYIYIYNHTHTHIHTIYIYTHRDIYTYTDIHTHRDTHIHTYICTHTCVYIYICCLYS